MVLARGEVVTNNNSEVTSVLVKIDNNRVGIKSIQTTPHRARFPHAVPLTKHDVVFCQRKVRI